MSLVPSPEAKQKTSPLVVVVTVNTLEGISVESIGVRTVFQVAPSSVDRKRVVLEEANNPPEELITIFVIAPLVGGLMPSQLTPLSVERRRELLATKRW